MVELKRIGPLSLAKLETIFMAFIGLLIGIFYAIIGMFISGLSEGALQEAGLDASSTIMFSPWAIIVMPLLYAILGFFSGLIGAGLYNLVAGWVGGVKIELSEQNKKK
ncbi:MAG: hypothetical protein AABX17_02535 [Nanoarchaeota archaeon]